MHPLVQETLVSAQRVAERAGRSELGVAELARGLAVALGEAPGPRRPLRARLARRGPALPVTEDTRRLIAELAGLDDERAVAARLLAEPSAARALAEDGHDVDSLRRRHAD